jgi:multidrug efflux pump subunit AcrA (membrane-fusion protein)
MQERTTAEERGALAAVEAQRRLEQAGGANALARQRAEAALDAAAAGRRAAAREAELAARELAAARQALAVAEEALANPVELAGNLAVAEAEVERARAARAAAAVELQIAARERDWLTVRAPASGVVFKVLAGPGSVAGPDGEPIVSLYDPQRLRARIDVPLGAVAGIREGQRVELRSEVLGATVVRGRVQRLQHESDLLKNTLQVKVEVLEPPPLLRPETLCRARFLAGEAASRPSGRSAFRVPKAAVQAGQVFVFDPAAGVARGVGVAVVSEDDAGVVVHGELSVAQRVILAPVRDGERVQEQPR